MASMETRWLYVTSEGFEELREKTQRTCVIPIGCVEKHGLHLPLGTDILKEYLPSTPSYNPSTDDWRTHPAVDFKGAEGSQIKAISNGTVKDIYDDALLGTVLVIDHGNQVEAKYCGLNKDTIEIEKGATVNEGQCIGYLGTVPLEKSELSHLHFEIQYKGKNVDPLELMGK